MFIDHDAKELNFKIVYAGPIASGKRSNVRYVYDRTPPDARGKAVSAPIWGPEGPTPDGPLGTSYATNIAPVGLGKIRGFGIRLHLYAEGEVRFRNDARKALWRGLDGFVYVADSSVDRIEANIESLENARQVLADLATSPETLPTVIQYNKRDLPNAAPVEELREALGFALDVGGVPEHEAIASNGSGVFDTLKSVVRLVLTELKAAG